MAPDYSHEMLTTVEIIRRLWATFHHLPQFFAVIANVDKPSADLVIISELGLGVVELKHYYGHITCRTNGGWYAGPKRMQAGVEAKGFKNPHEQVQAYAETIREQLIKPPPWQEPWLPGKTIDWPNFKFHTAVCFTHPDVDLGDFQENLRKRCRPVTLPWEDFSILTIDDIPEWAAALRFEVGTDWLHGFTRHRLTPPRIMKIVTDLFKLASWSEVYELMPTGAPYAYLTLIENERPIQVFALTKDLVTIGRDKKKCDVLIPRRFSLVSRIHAQITRTIQGVFIEDFNSTNGTFIDGHRVTRRTLLSHGQNITLGHSSPGWGVYQIKISFQVEQMDEQEITNKLEFREDPG